jgi:hypothetical protein
MMLALVWATNYFRCYLYGNKFLVRTYQSALTYLQNFADLNSRLLRWSIQLSELDFTVEHRSGSKIGHVEALSRHVGAVKQGATLNEEVVLREQEKDAFCVKQTPGTYNSKREFFLDADGILYEEVEQQISAGSSTKPYAGRHATKSRPCVRRSPTLIALRYWWPGMRKSVEDFARPVTCASGEKEIENLWPHLV